MLRRLVRLVVAASVLTVGIVPAAQAAEPRIVGGTTTTGSAHPWQVQVWGPRQSTLCGGVLLHERLVLTAAHCVPDSGRLTGYTMYAGRTSLTSGGEQLSFAATSVWVAPGYDPDALTDDWALVELSADATATPLLLAGTDEATSWDAGRDAVVTGFGTTTEDGSVSSTLRQVTVPVLADSTCSASSVYGSDFDDATMLCAGVMAGGQDSCSGDSGGPLRVTTDAGEPRLAGLVSWGIGCARAGYPGVYTRLAGDTVRTELLATIAAETDVDPAEVVGAAPSTTTDPVVDDTASPDDTACVAATASLEQRTAALTTATARLTTARARFQRARAKLARLKAHHRAAAVRRQRVVVATRRSAVATARTTRASAATAVAEARDSVAEAC